MIEAYHVVILRLHLLHTIMNSLHTLHVLSHSTIIYTKDCELARALHSYWRQRQYNTKVLSEVSSLFTVCTHISSGTCALIQPDCLWDIIITFSIEIASHNSHARDCVPQVDALERLPKTHTATCTCKCS